MTYGVKGSLKDIDGHVFEKEGDFGLLAIGRDEDTNIEADFSSMSEERIIYTVATILVIVGKLSPIMVQKAIAAYNERIKV